jgi:hypothetical protein
VSLLIGLAIGLLWTFGLPVSESKTFSCSQCGSEAYLALIEPIKEAGMQDYRLDAIERPERHPAATDRLTG